MSERLTGKVKFFNKSKGFGFIIRDGGGEDLFFHVSDVVGEIALSDGQAVTFTVGTGRKGQKATDIKLK